jgi:hypothetical protein
MDFRIPGAKLGELLCQERRVFNGTLGERFVLKREDATLVEAKEICYGRTGTAPKPFEAVGGGRRGAV